MKKKEKKKEKKLTETKWTKIIEVDGKQVKVNKIRYKSANKSQGKTAVTFGNSKMSIPMFSLPAIQCCPGSTEQCRKFCYAMKAQRLFVQTREKRQRNYELSMTEHFEEIIISELGLSIIPYVRIHDSGDFYSQEYLEKWYRIAEVYPERQFLAFTKNFALDYSKRPKNLVIYYSIFADTDKEVIKNLDKKIKKAYATYHKDIHKQRYGRVYTGSAKKCKGYCDTCLICFKNSHSVYFPLH